MVSNERVSPVKSVVVCCSVLQRVAVCCRLLQGSLNERVVRRACESIIPIHSVAACCSVS